MISFNERQSLGVALPSGLGVRGSGAGNQWTWRNFVQGVNQQDSNGNIIPVPVPTCPYSAVTWLPISDNNDSVGSRIGTACTVVATAAIVNPWESWSDFVGDFLYSGPLVACNLRVTIVDLSGDNGRVSFQISSPTHGNILLGDLFAVTAPGVYDFPYNLPASVNELVSVFFTVHAGWIGMPGGTGSANVTGDFCP